MKQLNLILERKKIIEQVFKTTYGKSNEFEYICVLNSDKTPVLPVSPANARQMLKTGKAAIYRKLPFTIILKNQLHASESIPIAIKIDPGSKKTGFAIVADFKHGKEVIHASELEHRGATIKQNLQDRAGVRRGRRSRLRYRAARFDNRRPLNKRSDNKKEKWLAPSLNHRVLTTVSWVKKYMDIYPITQIYVENVKFDMHKIINPDVSGSGYQRGALYNYEVMEYLLDKYNRTCVYCGANGDGVKFNRDHVIPKSKGGTNSIHNLVLCCVPCNQAKTNIPIEEFLKKKPGVLAKVKKGLKEDLKDAAAVNSTRWAVGKAMKDLGLPVVFAGGGVTKFNRLKQGFTKAHWIDAACVGHDANNIRIPKHIRVLQIKSMGHGSRQMQRNDKFGFPAPKYDKSCEPKIRFERWVDIDGKPVGMDKKGGAIEVDESGVAVKGKDSTDDWLRRNRIHKQKEWAKPNETEREGWIAVKKWPTKWENGKKVVVKPRSVKTVQGFSTGDIVNVKIINSKKYKGFYKSVRVAKIGAPNRIAFKNKAGETVSTTTKNCVLIQKGNGYSLQYDYC
jgi:5-methylcytosine-specific restriction endonuclease McrA